MKRISVLMLLGVMIAACGGEPDAESSLENKSFREVMKEAAEDEYNPPADGKITERQLDMYLEIREHEKKVAEAARQKLADAAEEMKGEEKSLKGFLKGVKSMGNMADFLTADVRAAQDLGYNTKEYLWVKGAIGEAVAIEATSRLLANVEKQMQDNREQIEKRLEEASSDAEKKMYEGLLTALDERAETQAEQAESRRSEAAIYNLELLQSREDIAETIGSEFSRWGADISTDDLRNQLSGN